MNAVINSPAAPADEVRAAHVALAEARHKHEADLEALRGGHARLASTKAELDRLAAEDTEAIGREARRLEEQTRAGKVGPVPSSVTSDAQIAAQIVATRTHAIAVRMVTNLEAAEARSRDELAAAECSVEAAVDALLAVQDIKTAQRMLQLSDEIIGFGRQLPNPLEVSLNKLQQQPLVVQQACALVDKLRPDGIYRPISEWNGPAAGIFRAGDVTYRERRAALIAGPTDGAPEPAAEDAA
jgi:hypothetical protein